MLRTKRPGLPGRFFLSEAMRAFSGDPTSDVRGYVVPCKPAPHAGELAHSSHEARILDASHSPCDSEQAGSPWRCPPGITL